MDKIKRISHYFRILFQIVFGVEIIASILLGFYGPSLYSIGSFSIGFTNLPPYGSVTANAFSPPVLDGSIKFLSFLIECIPTGLSLAILYCLIKLFQRYEHAEIFTLRNAKYIKSIGYFLLANTLAQPIADGLISFVQSRGHTMGISFGSNTISEVITAAIVILISWVMTEAHKLKEEQTYTV